MQKPALTVSGTTIPYEIRRSPRAKHIRINVRPGGVTVTVPRFARRARIEGFVDAKRRWIYEKTEALKKQKLIATPERYVSGARVLFRGRYFGLWVESGRVAVPSLRFSNGFHVEVPEEVSGDCREELVRRLVIEWLEERARVDAVGWIQRYGKILDAHPTRTRIASQKTLWGSCSAGGVVSLNWRLVTAPRAVFEYVVVHELCHLVERNHGPRFWELMESVLPGYEESRAWLEKHGLALRGDDLAG